MIADVQQPESRRCADLPGHFAAERDGKSPSGAEYPPAALPRRRKILIDNFFTQPRAFDLSNENCVAEPDSVHRLTRSIYVPLEVIETVKPVTERVKELHHLFEMHVKPVVIVRRAFHLQISNVSATEHRRKSDQHIEVVAFRIDFQEIDKLNAALSAKRIAGYFFHGDHGFRLFVVPHHTIVRR
jgi:hypothetical protein